MRLRNELRTLWVRSRGTKSTWKKRSKDRDRRSRRSRWSRHLISSTRIRWRWIWRSLKRKKMIKWRRKWTMWRWKRESKKNCNSKSKSKSMSKTLLRRKWLSNSKCKREIRSSRNWSRDRWGLRTRSKRKPWKSRNRNWNMITWLQEWNKKS